MSAAMSIAQTIAALRDAALGCDDATAYFPALYTVVTERISDAIDSGKRFEDGPRLDRFATAFADLHLRARTDPSYRPRCWQACWDVASDKRLLIVQHVLLGINAHVNHDLPIATVATCGDAPLESMQDDFNSINDVLGETYHEIIRSLGRVSGWANAAASMGGGQVFNFSLRVGRDRAWGTAQNLYAKRQDEAVAAAYRKEIDEVVSVLSYLITQPPKLAKPVVWALRKLENKDPRAVTRSFLGMS